MLRRSIYIVLTTVLVGISFGCSKEVDEAPNPVQAPLTGVWEAYLYTFQGMGAVKDRFLSDSYAVLTILTSFIRKNS